MTSGYRDINIQLQEGVGGIWWILTFILFYYLLLIIIRKKYITYY